MSSKPSSLKPLLKPVSHFQQFQTATPNPTQLMKRGQQLPVSSSSAIDDRSPRPSTTQGIATSSPIDVPSIPLAPVITRKPIEFAPDEDDDEDLPTFDMAEMLAKNKKQKQAEKLAALKAAAAAAAATKKAQQSDDDEDSDLEIEGAPVRAVVPARKSTFAATSTPKGHSRHRSTSTKLVSQPTLENALSAPRATPHERLLKEIEPKFGVVEEDLSESQTVAAARTFNSAARPAIRTSKAGVQKVVPVITQEQTDKALRAKIHQQNLAARTKKQAQFRRDESTRAEEDAGKVGAKIDVTSLLKLKAEKSKLDKEQKLAEDEDEDEDDGDYADEDEEMGEDDGSGSEGTGIDDMAEESDAAEVEEEETMEEADDEGNVLPRPPMNASRLGTTSEAIAACKENDHAQNDDDEEESLITVPRSRARFVVTGDEDDEEEDAPAPVINGMTTPVAISAGPGRIILPSFLDAGGDGGFSQFFGTAFSQAVGGNNEVRFTFSNYSASRSISSFFFGSFFVLIVRWLPETSSTFRSRL